LRLHAGYRCRHRGVCCTAGWAIPIEAPQEALLVRAIGRGAFPRITVDSAFVADTREAGEPAVLNRAGPQCVFHGPDRLCEIHRVLGHAALPSACRHFPRVVVLDPRGTFLSLSHVCPTVGALLFDDRPAPFDLVSDGPLFTPGATWEGLDARDALPPQLGPGVLWDWDAWSRWERHVLVLLDRSAPSAALDALTRAAMRLQNWRPTSGQSLADRVEDVWAAHDAHAAAGPGPHELAALDAAVRASVPPALGAPPAPVDWARAWYEWVAPARDWTARPAARYLAARVVANWVGYYGSGLTTWARSIAAAYAVFEVECARIAAAAGRPLQPDDLVTAAGAADHLVVHLSSPPLLAAALDAWGATPA
jgi:Fe-S-cluster containining protein